MQVSAARVPQSPRMVPEATTTVKMVVMRKVKMEVQVKAVVKVKVAVIVKLCISSFGAGNPVLGLDMQSSKLQDLGDKQYIIRGE